MAEFIYKDYSTELKFGNYVFELPLNEQTADLLDKEIYQKYLRPTPEGIEGVNAFYNDLMDGFDIVFGEGAADKIMSNFKHPGILEATLAAKFIVEEYLARYTEATEDMKKTAPKTAPVNRAERRARR